MSFRIPIASTRAKGGNTRHTQGQTGRKVEKIRSGPAGRAPLAHACVCVCVDRLLSSEDKDRTEESVLQIKRFQSKDLNREINCSVWNPRGFDTRRAELQEEGTRRCHDNVTSFLAVREAADTFVRRFVTT